VRRRCAVNATASHVLFKDRMTRAADKMMAAGLVLGAMIIVYWSVLTGLVSAWSTDDNYSHAK
jgi:hypothetical protein